MEFTTATLKVALWRSLCCDTNLQIQLHTYSFRLQFLQNGLVCDGISSIYVFLGMPKNERISRSRANEKLPFQLLLTEYSLSFLQVKRDLIHLLQVLTEMYGNDSCGKIKRASLTQHLSNKRCFSTTKSSVNCATNNPMRGTVCCNQFTSWLLVVNRNQGVVLCFVGLAQQ